MIAVSNKHYAFFGFGEHRFYFTKKGKEIRLDVEDWLNRHEASYFFENIEQLKQIAFDKTCALRFYIFMRGDVYEFHWNEYFVPCLNKHKIFN